MRTKLCYIMMCALFAFCLQAQDKATEKRLDKPYKKTIGLKAALKDPLAAKDVFIDQYADSVFPNETVMALKNVEYIALRGRFIKDRIKDSARPPVRIRIDTVKFRQLSQLTRIDFESFDFNVFPKELYALTQLKGINIAVCRVAELPPGISRLSGLTYIDLRLNELSSLPDDLYDLPNLETLDLCNNQFTRLPEKITQLKSLRYLYLANLEVFRRLPEGVYSWPYPFNVNKINYNAQYDLLKQIIKPEHFMVAYLTVAECGDKGPLKEKLKEDGLSVSVWVGEAGCDK